MTASVHAGFDRVTPGGEVSRRRRWVDPRSPRAGFGSRVLGGICCLAAGITTAVGVGAAGFVTGVMDRYQPYFIAVSVLVMGAWLVRQLSQPGALRSWGARAVVAVAARDVVAMGAVYVATLGIAMGISRLGAM